MGKHSNTLSAVYSIFGLNEWVAESIKTLPSNFVGVVPGNEYIRVHIIASGKGVQRGSMSGIVNIDIFVPSGAGPNRAAAIADTLDKYLESKIKQAGSGTVQFGESTVRPLGADPANSSLYRSLYAIQFNYFGV